MLERQQTDFFGIICAVKAILDSIQGCELFDGMNLGEANRMLECLDAHVISRDKGAAIFVEGSHATRFGVVLSGSLVVVKDGLDGKRTIIKRIGEKELVAAAQAFSGAKTMRVRVEADAPSKVLILNAERVGAPCCNACAFHTRLVRNVMRILAAKTLELNAKIEILSHRTTEDRLLAYLRSFADKCGKSEFDIPFDRQQLADYLCVERSALSAEISRLADKGVLSSRKNHFVLK